MAPRIAVVHPPLRISRHFVDAPYHSDLGAVQAAAVLWAAGLDVTLVDAFALPDSHVAEAGGEHFRLGAPVSSVCAAVPDADVLLVHITPYHRPPGRDPLLSDLLAGLRRDRPETPIVLADLYQGGEHYIEAAPELVAAAYPEADILLCYQAEEELADLCAGLARSGRPGRLRVLAGPPVEDLDALPLPAWGLVDLEARDRFHARVSRDLGRAPFAFPIDGRTLPAVTSRGCPYGCVHCSSNPGRPAGEPRRQRRLSAARVEALVRDLCEVHRATRVAVMDEMANAGEHHLDALLRSLGRFDVAYDFPNGLRADRVSRAQLEAMASRVATLSVSAESGSQRVLDEVVGKQLRLEAVEATVATAASLGIGTMVHFVIGLPGETREEVNQTLEMAIDLWERHGAWPAVQFATPLPGTRLAELEPARGPVDDYGPLFQHRPVAGPVDLPKFAWSLGQRLALAREPEKVILNTTYRCNNRCDFCAVGDRPRVDGLLEDQRRILRHYREKGLRLVDFDGGEPTLYPHLVALLREARALGYETITVTTNGRMCAYPEYARRLVNAGLTTLLVSLHGADAATHGACVNDPEAFEQTVRGIRNLVAARPAGVEIGTNTTVTRSNVGTLCDVVRLASYLGLRWLNIQLLTPFGTASAQEDPGLTAAAGATMRVIDAWRGRMKLQVVNAPFCAFPGYEGFVLGDVLKVRRRMVFVDPTTGLLPAGAEAAGGGAARLPASGVEGAVNLHDYLLERRRRTPQCAGCAYRILCGGFYVFDDRGTGEGAIRPEASSGTGESSESPKRST